MYSPSTWELPAPPTPPAPPQQPAISTQGYVIAGVILALSFVVVIAGVFVGGEFGRFVEAGLQYLPVLPLAILAQIGERQLWARVLTYIYAVVLQLGIGLLTLGFVVAVLLPANQAQGALFRPGALVPVAGIALILFVLFVLCSAVLLRPVRVFLSRWLPIDPDRLLHTVALWVALFAALSAYAQLAYLGGKPPILTAIQSGTLGADAIGGGTPLEQNLTLLYGLLWLIPVALIAAGWPLTRSFRSTLTRLGLVKPTLRQVLFGLGGAVVLAVTFTLVDQAIAQIWGFFGWPVTDTAAFNKLLGETVSPVGAIVIGFTAGLGEELGVRGLLQPRLGLILSNLVFTSLHAFQYGPDALLSVFLLGSILGLIRARTNTTTSAIMHGTYDFLGVIAIYLSAAAGGS